MIKNNNNFSRLGLFELTLLLSPNPVVLQSFFLVEVESLFKLIIIVSNPNQTCSWGLDNYQTEKYE